ncbi:hypothetical protein ACA910_013415 [Epithemia clementina (nom. ined.)]
MYNSFGGKLDGEQERQEPILGAQRELQEETGIVAPLEALHRVGTLEFTFDDDDETQREKMVVHLFRVHVIFTTETCDNPSLSTKSPQPPNSIRLNPNTVKNVSTNTSTIPIVDENDEREITPIWFDDWCNIPLHNMFADDSIWLTRLLMSSWSSSSSSQIQEPEPFRLNGWFHFQSGGAEVNTLLHYYVQLA